MLRLGDETWKDSSNGKTEVTASGLHMNVYQNFFYSKSHNNLEHALSSHSSLWYLPILKQGSGKRRMIG
jgi:hypothetical protein